MIIGTTKELKTHEYRVGITPDNAAVFVADSLGYDYAPIESLI